MRQESYAEHAWPPPMGRLFERNGTSSSPLATLLVTLVLLLTVALQDPAVLFAPQRGDRAPSSASSPLADQPAGRRHLRLRAWLALAMGGWRYWRGTARRRPARVGAGGRGGAAVDILTLRNLGGGGHGCNDIDDSFSHAAALDAPGMFLRLHALLRRHHGGRDLPPPARLALAARFLSLPVQLGTWGGVLLCIGAAGLLWLKTVTDPAPVARRLLGGEYAILALLFLIGATGLLLLAAAPHRRDGHAARAASRPGARRSSSRCPIRRWCTASIAASPCCATHRRSEPARWPPRHRRRGPNTRSGKKSVICGKSVISASATKSGT